MAVLPSTVSPQSEPLEVGVPGPTYCTIDGWCADLPSGYAGQLRATWGGTDGEAVSVGSDGLVAARGADGTWVFQQVGTSSLKDVDGDGDRVVIVGYDATIIERTDAGWRRLPPPPGTSEGASLQAVLVEGDAIVLALARQLYRYEGDAWTPLGPPLESRLQRYIRHLARLPDGRLAVGLSDASSETLSGDRWESLHAGSSWGRHYGFTVDGDVLWYVNSHKIGRIDLSQRGARHFYDGHCTAVVMFGGAPHGLCDDGLVRLREPTPDDRPDLFSPGYERYDPRRLIASPVLPKMAVWGMAKTGETLLLAGRSLVELDARGHRVVAGWPRPKLEGVKETQVLGGRGPTLRATDFPSLTALARTGRAITAVGDQGVVWQRDPAGDWTLLHHTGNRLHALKKVWGRGADDFATFGWNRVFLVRRGGTWTRRKVAGSWESLYSDGPRAIAVGSNGQTVFDLAYDGQQWGQAEPFDGYAGYPRGWAVSGRRAVYFDGATRTSDAQSPVLTAIWEGPGARIGVGDRLLHRHDGTAWSSVDLADVPGCPAEGRLHGVTGRGDDDVWVAGERGLVVHWDGASWSCEHVGIDLRVEAIVLTEANAFVAVGPYVLRKQLAP